MDLAGTTFIDEKTNITTSTFATVPDVPVNSFELYLPEGGNSALAAPTSLCAAAAATKVVKRQVTRRRHGHRVRRTVLRRVAAKGLAMPTEFVAQNGLVLKQSTKIAVTGCAKSRAAAAGRGKRARASRRRIGR